MSMMKYRFVETSRKNVEAKADRIKEVPGLVPWGEPKVNPESCLEPWNPSDAEHKQAVQNALNYFAR